jgi:hypothetical protein
MLKISSSACLSYAKLCDSYGFYEQADFYENLVNTRLSQVNYNYNKQPAWIREQSFPEKAFYKTLQYPVTKLEKSNLSTKQKDLTTDAIFGSLDAADVAFSTPQAIQAAKKAQELSTLLKNNPAAAESTKKAAQQISTKVPVLGKLMSMAPFIGVLINLYLTRQEIAKYFDLINNGKLNEIWNDPEERSKFIEIVLMTIAGALTLPVIAAIPVYGQIMFATGTALYAASSALSLGRTAIDAYLVGTGEKNSVIEQISKDDYSLENEFSTILQGVSQDVKSAAKIVSKHLVNNPSAKFPEIFALEELKQYPWVNSNVAPEDNLKYNKLMQIVVILRKLAGKKKSNK